MKRIKKGFTLVEAVVTIGIMSVVFGLSAVCFSNLFRIQNASSENTRRQAEANRINSFILDFVSFLSVETDDLNFNFESVSGTSINFSSNKGSTHTLSYLNKHLACSYNYSGDIDYLKYDPSISVELTSQVAIDYNDTLNILKFNCSISGRDYSFAYVLKV